MGIATDHSPAEYGGMSAYGRWEIDVRLFDASMTQIDAFTTRQDLWIGENTFVVRLTRDVEGTMFSYEDRGTFDASGRITGTSGFGGKLTGMLLPNNGVFTEGKGGDADFVLVATQTGKDHYRCFRRFAAPRPNVLWGTQVTTGTYYITTEDHLLEEADAPPAEVREPLRAMEKGLS